MFRLALLVLLAFARPSPAAPPNILWLTSEDHGPHMGCYGDAFATTPNVDALAKKGMIYTRVWSNAPVCAPARTTIISGLYPPSTGAEHMRSMLPFPAGKQMFPQYLRQAGYYCTNRAKEDYNLAKPGQVWDESSAKGHWRNRKAGQPFFAVFNSEKSHESKIRVRPHVAVHDPLKVRIPAYHPDTPEVRRDWAQYYDCVSAADADAGARLKELADDGLEEDTIVFYFADHGSGMPRNKRSACNSGLHVPMVVYIPEKFKHLALPDYKAGGKSDRLVSFVDLAPTVLTLAGVKPPEWLQGLAFLGKDPRRREYNFGFRGRMDERPDFVRSVTDGRFVYVRNYLPHLAAGRHLDYMFQTPTTRVWKDLFDAGKLNEAQSAFWKPKPSEELFDLRSDPDEVKNLANDPAHDTTLKRLRFMQRRLSDAFFDVGFLPEGDMHERFKNKPPYDDVGMGTSYSFANVFVAAERASGFDMKDVPALREGFKDRDAAVRWWSATGLLIRGPKAVAAGRAELIAARKDDSAAVRVAAAEALAVHGMAEDQKDAVAALVSLASWETNSVFTAVAALNALDAAGDAAKPHAAAIRKLPLKGKTPDARYSPYVPRLVTDLTAK